MKLVAIYNVWNDYDLLDQSVENISQCVDSFIIVVSTRSNYNEYAPIPDRWKEFIVVREPHFNIPMHSETDKRNFGLDIARKQGFTHFIMMDADEFYHPEQFLKAKERFLNPNLAGLVCPLNCYFKEPTLTIGRDTTLVPFIHKITPTLKFEFNKQYPFAWSGKQIRIDPTRSMNINTGVEYTEEVVMEHYSWVRKDIEVKIRNSTARRNLERSTIREDYANARPGVYNKFYQKVLTEAPNYFNITANNPALSD